MKHITVKLTEEQLNAIADLVFDKVEHYKHVTSKEHQKFARVAGVEYAQKLLEVNKKQYAFYKRLLAKVS